MVKIEVENLKSLREDLCMAQSALRIYGGYTNPQDAAIKRLGKVLDQIDILRPLGSNGKHGNLHTEHCGCEDNPYLDLLNEWRVVPSFPMYEVSGRGDVRISDHSNPDTPETITARYIGGQGEPEYDLYSLEAGYVRSYTVPVRSLIRETFPELNK